MSRQSNFTTDITKSFRNLKVNDKKKNKRLSLTDSEASDSTPVIPPSRSRGVGGAVVTSWKGDSSREGSHAREMQKIKSSLQPYAASDISAESVHSLAVEYNVDQTIAEDAVKSSPNHEAAREKIIQFLKRRIDHEKHLARNNNNNSSSRPPAYPTDYKNEYHVPPPNIYNREPHTRTHRGSPDGASLRAESPVGLYGHNGHQNKLVNKVNNFRQQIARSDYDILPRKNQLDQTKVTRQYIVPDRTPATDPPAYPGNQAPLTNSLPYSRRSSTSENGNDVSSRNAQHNSLPRPNHILPNPNTAADVQYRRGQTPPPNLTYERNMNSSTSAGISPGHVNKIVQSWSPSEPPPNSGNLYRQANSRPQQNVPVPQMTSSSVMPKNHKPIIKGSVTTISQPAPTNHQGSRFTPSHPPPSYTVAQQFKSKQKEMGASGYTHPDNPYSVDVQNQPHIVRARTSPGPYSDQQMSNPINVALLGNISYASYPHPHPSISGHSSSPQSSISSGYQLTVEPCPAQYHTLRNPQILQASGQPVVRPQPMQVEVPRNCEAVPGRYAQMSMESDMMGVQALSDRNLRYHHYMTEREPPSYVESLSGGSTSLTSSDMTANYRDGDINYMTEDHKSRKSNVAENYLNAVDNSGNGNPVLVKPPKGTETAVQAARVTASNSKRQHACSYSAVADAKQRKPGSMSGLNDPPRSPMHVDVPPEDTVDPRDKTVSMSPVPVRKKHKPKTSSKRNGHSSESEEEDEGQERNGSRARMFSSDAYKFYMEQHIENVFKNCNSRISRRDQLEQEMKKLNLPAPEQSQMRGMLFQKESNYIRLKRGKIDLSMFQTIKPLGVGAFGRVFLAKKTGTGKLYAIKTLRKKEVLTRNQVAHVKAERDILSEADNDWVVKLYYTFQDKQFLYFVMDYIPGGDMMSLLIKKGIFEESLAQFYTAELTLALESVHRMGFIHRDIKPDNILIDRDGHIKLTDFGLCTGFRWTHDSKYYQRGGHRQQDSMDFSNEWHKHNSYPLKTLDRRRIRDANRHIARSLVGTPNYIAPEVLLREGYTQLCDWWSVGVILYEMVVGQPPFNADTPQETQIKVVNWETILCFPDTARLKRNTKDFIRRLCCGQSQRLGCRGIDEIKGHPYFRHIDWVNLRNVRAPFVPKIKYAEDTSNFDAPDDDTFNQSQAGTLNNTLLRAGEHAFFEFTFRRFFDEDGRAYSSQHYTPDNNMTIDEAAELAHSDDYSNQYYQANGEWSQGGGGGHNNGGRAASNDGFYF